MEMIVVLLGTLLLSLFWAGYVQHQRFLRRLNAITARVLINGTRGKSSVTRLVWGALSAGGMRAVARTTGSAARLIHPDGTEEEQFRRLGRANVSEYIDVVRRASVSFPDVFVAECMAIDPNLQEVVARRLVCPQLTVITNVREDHLAEMGPGLDDIARSMSRTMVRGGICVTAERDQFEILAKEAEARGAAIVFADVEGVTEEEMASFDQLEIKENVAIALAVAEQMGVPRDVALAGMVRAPKDPGATTMSSHTLGEVELVFLNLFAANDPTSTVWNIRQLLDRKELPLPMTLVINCRRDRVERNAQMGALVHETPADRVVVIGEETRSAVSAIRDDYSGEVLDLGARPDMAQVVGAICAGRAGTASAVAIGNIHGDGEALLSYLESDLDSPQHEHA